MSDLDAVLEPAARNSTRPLFFFFSVLALPGACPGIKRRPRFLGTRRTSFVRLTTFGKGARKKRTSHRLTAALVLHLPESVYFIGRLDVFMPSMYTNTGLLAAECGFDLDFGPISPFRLT